MLVATIEVMPKPKEFATWTITLKTPPASPCVFSGKEDDITRFETVYSTIQIVLVRTLLRRLYSPSAESGIRHIAGNAATQYEESSSILASKSGAANVTSVATRTSQ